MAPRGRARRSDAHRVALVILGVFRALRPVRPAAPRDVARGHVADVAYAEQHRALRSVGVFMDLAGRMHDERAGHHRDGLARRAHGAADLEAEIDFGGVRVAMIRADLAGLPAGHGDVAVLDRAEDLL